ncbi:MAG: hypothetical protein GX868_10335 [Actinobacteria bacterium]|nr:hypothetical protein [Actinomycetota bacterium]
MDGFVVPKGAVAIGAPLRLPSNVIYKGVPVKERGWRIYFAVPGDPRPVVADLAQQLDRSGFTMRPAEFIDQGWKTTTTAFCTQNASSYDCAGLAQPAAPQDRRTVVLMFHRREAENGRPPESHLQLTLFDSDRPQIFNQPLGDAGASVGPNPPAVTPAWPSLPNVGAQFGLGYDPAAEPLTVEPDSRLIAATVQSSGCLQPGYEALLTLDRDHDDVFKAYLAQAQRVVDGTRSAPTPTETKFQDGSQLTTATVSDMAGVMYTFALTEPESGTAVLNISTCVS